MIMFSRFNFLMSVVIVLVASSSGIASEAASSLPLTIDAAVQQGLRSNAAILQLREKLNETSGSQSLSHSALFPTANLSTIGQRKKDAVFGKTPGTVAFDGNSYDYYSLDMNVSQPLLVFGSFDAIKKIDLDDDIAHVDLKIAERDLTTQIIQAFYKTISSQRQWRLLTDELDIVQESLATAQKRFQIGRGQLLDVLQVKTQLALLKPKIEDSKNQMTIAVAQLATLLGSDDQVTLNLKSYLPSIKMKDVLKLIDHENGDLPELKRIRLQKEQNSVERSQLLGKDLPQLRFNFDYNFANYAKSDVLNPDSNSWNAQLILTIPLFSGLSSRYEGQVYASRDIQLEHQYVDKSSNLKLSQISAKKALESSEVSLNSSAEAVDLADRSFKEAQKNYRLATIDFLQYLQVQQSRLDAILNNDQIKTNSILATANYLATSGQDMNHFVEFLNQQNSSEKK